MVVLTCFVMSGCVYVRILYYVGVLVMYVPVFTVFLYCLYCVFCIVFVYVYLFLFVLSVLV